MKNQTVSVIIFGLLLAVLMVILHFFEYRYKIGSLSTEIYTSIVATLFTAVGIWIGVNFLKSQKSKEAIPQGPDLEKIKELRLNDREYQVLRLISEGLTNQEIADRLFIALPTVKTHTSNLYSKLDVRSRTQAVRKAQSLRLI